MHDSLETQLLFSDTYYCHFSIATYCTPWRQITSVWFLRCIRKRFLTWNNEVIQFCSRGLGNFFYWWINRCRQSCENSFASYAWRWIGVWVDLFVGNGVSTSEGKGKAIFHPFSYSPSCLNIFQGRKTGLFISCFTRVPLYFPTSTKIGPLWHARIYKRLVNVPNEVAYRLHKVKAPGWLYWFHYNLLRIVSSMIWNTRRWNRVAVNTSGPNQPET